MLMKGKMTINELASFKKKIISSTDMEIKKLICASSKNKGLL